MSHQHERPDGNDGREIGALSPRLEVARLVPGAGFSVTEYALGKIGRSSIIRNLHSPSEVTAAARPLQVIPAGGTWNFEPEGGRALAMLDEAYRTLGGFDHLTVVFDCAGEGFGFNAAQHQVVADHLKRRHLRREQVYLLTSRLDPDRTYRRWCDEHGQEPAFSVVYSPVQLYLYAGIYREAMSLEFLDRLVARRSPTLGTPRRRKFVTLNFMPREARWATLLVLMEEGLLDQGYVSFHGSAAPESVGDAPPSLDHVRAQLRQLKVPEHLVSRVDELQAMSPMVLEEPGGSRDEKAYGVADQAYWGDAYFAIVSESDFPAYAGSRFTEKVLKPLANLLPFVLIGTPGTLRELRRLGFMTFDGLIDESYDDIEDASQRLEAALREAVRLARMPMEELKALYEAAWPRLVHNLMHLLTVTPHMVDRDEAFLALSATE